ncbi:uncharacterized protein LOC135206143 [Macrobrachium nipponense]|uniref:uncharacterized protein LOC135206143 n=1 Tax=Macrobrachium nipponense TaxID=159736 RepID=UPI0030C850D2
MPGAVPGFCNLECWCHVPTRGVHKPPCYLCVIDCCSLSSKKEATPSAPSLTSLEETEPAHLPSASVETETQPNDTNTPSAQPPPRSYGWRESLQRRASLGIVDQGTAHNQNFFAETYISLPPDPENAQPETEAPGPSRGTGPAEGVYIPEPDYFTTPVESPVSLEGSRDDEDTGTACDDEAEESNAKQMTRIQINSDSRPIDLAELIRNVMLDPRDPSDDEDEDTSENTETQSVPSGKQQFERNPSRRRRDRNQGADKYQSFYNTGAKPYLIARASLTRHQSLNGALSQSETEFQRLHKIHRRDTSSDAARRYLQSDENLHRTWWKQVSSRKRNHPRKSPSSKRHDGASHRSLTNFEEVWRSHRS